MSYMSNEINETKSPSSEEVKKPTNEVKESSEKKVEGKPSDEIKETSENKADGKPSNEVKGERNSDDSCEKPSVRQQLKDVHQDPEPQAQKSDWGGQTIGAR